MQKILNLTNHPATSEQLAAGVVEPADKVGVQQLLNFEQLPTGADIEFRAQSLALHAVESGVDAAMIGGAPFLMSALERALLQAGIKPVYAFSRRESAEEAQPDGSVRKVAVFRHLGFVSVARYGAWWAFGPSAEPGVAGPVLAGPAPTRGALGPAADEAASVEWRPYLGTGPAWDQYGNPKPEPKPTADFGGGYFDGDGDGMRPARSRSYTGHGDGW